MIRGMSRLDSDFLAALTRHAAASAGAPVRIKQVDTIPLKGGYVSKAVDRLDLTLATPNRSGITASFVRKACFAREVRALELLATIPKAPALPEIIASWWSAERPDDLAANGFTTPFYPGRALTFDDPIPDVVLVSLARVHAACRGTEGFDWTWTFDAAHFADTHANALAALGASARFRATTADHIGWLTRLERLCRSEVLREASDDLPKSLVHGDMHPGNIILRADGSPVIIDWGNACIAPPMLDLANIVRIDSPQWHTYFAAYREAVGGIDEATSRRAFWWARAATGLQYLPWVAEHTADASRTIVQIEEAHERLSDSR
jgi:hypothetical protein